MELSQHIEINRVVFVDLSDVLRHGDDFEPLVQRRRNCDLRRSSRFGFSEGSNIRKSFFFSFFGSGRLRRTSPTDFCFFPSTTSQNQRPLVIGSTVSLLADVDGLCWCGTSMGNSKLRRRQPQHMDRVPIHQLHNLFLVDLGDVVAQLLRRQATKKLNFQQVFKSKSRA